MAYNLTTWPDFKNYQNKCYRELSLCLRRPAVHGLYLERAGPP